MLNTNNTVNYEINVKRKEKKYSWSTVFAWLYLKTIGRILPKKWNKWAENILYYNKATGSDEIRTDKTTDESAQIDLKPEVAVKESQSEVVNEDEKVQTNKVTFQDIAMTDGLTTVDESVQIEPEIAEKGSQSEIISKDGEVQTEENSKFTGKGCFDTIVNGEFIDEDYDSMEEVSIEEDEELNKQLEDVSQELELERSQNVLLEEENRELKFTITRLEKNHKELAEDAGKREEELVGVKEKDMKINSLTWLNEALEQDKKEMEAKNNEQQRTISDQEKRIREQDALIKSLTDKNEAIEKGNESLQMQITELEGKVSGLEGKIQESKQQLEKEKIDLEGKLKDLNSQLSTMVKEREDSKNEVSKLQKQVQILEGSKEWELAGIDDSLKKVFLDVIGMLEKELLINNQEQQLQGKKVDLEGKLKILISQLNTAEEGNKAEGIERLKASKEKSDEELQETRGKLAAQKELVEQLKKEQKQVESQLEADIKKLQEEKENMEEQLKIMQQQLLNNQEQQKLEEKLKGVDKRLEDIDKKTKKSQEQTKAHKPDAVSTVSTAKSTTESTLSKLRNLPNKLFGDKNLNNFLSKKNEELKKGFPEFKEKHFCHNVLDKTIKSLSNQNHGKFESSKLLELLESNLKQSAREIIEAKVKEVVNEHCNIGKNVGKELRDGTLKAKLSPSVRKCVKKLEFNKQEEGVNKIVDSILRSFNNRNNNNDSGELLKEIAVEELVEARMKPFSSKVQELQLASSIRDKFLSPDQKMCSHVLGEGNTYQLSTNKTSRPNSLMNYTNTASIHSLSSQRVVKVGS